MFTSPNTHAANIFVATGVELGEDNSIGYLAYQLAADDLAVGLQWIIAAEIYNITAASAGDTSASANRKAMPESAGQSISGSLFCGRTATNELLLANLD